MTELPDYADLPPAPRGGRSAWGLFGAGDNLGLVNLMTPERIAAAARLVRRGQIFCLDMPIGSISPALATFRGPPRHQVLHQPGTAGFDDVYDNFYPQASSQWDSLAHIGYAPDQMYNGATEQEVLAGTRNTIEHWARHGLAGRAVLLDAERAMRDAGRPYDPGAASPIGVADLELARRQAGVEFAAGDIILLHTGFAAWYVQQPSEVKNRLHGNVAAPGIEHTEAVCEYLWNSHAAAIASDTYRRRGLPRRHQPSSAPVRVPAQHAHRPARDGPGRAVVAQRPGRRLRRRRRVRDVRSQHADERARRNRLARQRRGHQIMSRGGQACHRGPLPA